MIDGLFGGQYFLRLLGGALVQSMVANGKDYTYEPFDFTDGASISDIVITVTTGATLTGAVHTATGREAAQAAVVYFPQDRRHWSTINEASPFMGIVPARTDGLYETRGRPPAGRYYVVAVEDTWRESWRDPRFLEAAASVATVVDIGRGERKVQDLQLQVIRLPK
jgi:hypothetical protein